MHERKGVGATGGVGVSRTLSIYIIWIIYSTRVTERAKTHGEKVLDECVVSKPFKFNDFCPVLRQILFHRTSVRRRSQRVTGRGASQHFREHKSVKADTRKQQSVIIVLVKRET